LKLLIFSFLKYEYRYNNLIIKILNYRSPLNKLTDFLTLFDSKALTLRVQLLKKYIYA